MHFEPHATLGWVIGNLGGGDRRVRTYCTVGAVLPDIDAVPYVFGPQAFAEWHHTFGHNVFLWAAFTAWAGWRCRSWRAVLLVFLSFGSHLLTDAQFSGWKQYLFWPVSHAGYGFPGIVQLDHPLNYWFVYLSFVVVVLVATAYKRTPLDIFSPKLDAIFMGIFRKKNLACGVCGKPAGQLCEQCGRPLCLKHGTLRRPLQLVCTQCARPGGTRPASPPG